MGRDEGTLDHARLLAVVDTDPHVARVSIVGSHDEHRHALRGQRRQLERGARDDVLEVLTRLRRDREASPGSLLSLLVGLLLIGGGLLQYLSRLIVWSGFGFGSGQLSAGLLFVPLILGAALLFGGGRTLRYLGIALVALSVVALFGLSLAGLRLFFLPTPFLQVLATLVAIGIGLGLTVRGLRRL